MALYVRQHMIPDIDPLVQATAIRANLIVIALEQQIVNVELHTQRVIEHRDRYERGSISWASVEMQRCYWMELLTVLRAVQSGKAVQPS